MQANLVDNQRKLAMAIMTEKTQLSTKQKELTKWEEKVYKNK
jgi:hypothetical protein